MALGARHADVLKMILAEGWRLATLGIVIGLAAAAAATRIIGKMLFGVRPADPLTFAGVSILLTAAGLAASFIPGTPGNEGRSRGCAET